MLSLPEIGRRAEYIRIKVLKLNQQELANKLGVIQNTISRFETGKGVTVETILLFVNFLYKNDIDGHKLFYEFFEPESFEKKDYLIEKDKLIELLKENQEEQNKFYSDFLLRMKSLNF